MVACPKVLLISAVCLIGLLLTATDIEKAAELRQDGNYSRAEKLLDKYSSPANFDQLKSTDKIEFLNGLLELAHVRALKDDVPGALALLNWAESREDPYQRAIACVKYAEILIDLGEFERASGYLKNADEVITKRATDKNTGAAIGQGGEVTDSGGAWRNLRDDSDALKAEIEAEEMKKKFGATYGNYVKLRRLQRLVKRSRTPRYLNEALKVADEIIEIDPTSQFAAAAGYLKGEIFASRLKEESPKKDIREVKDYLNKFVGQQPGGLYRGEALMLLGKISLEIEWNAKDAEKYYAQALEYFRKAREKRDAVSLYAAINDDLKKQSTPTQKPTTLNQWKRTIYHDEDPLKLYNTANAPSWYISDKEKNCVFVLGLVAFSNQKYDIAKEHWERIKEYSPETAIIDPRLPVTVHERLIKSCRLKAMAFWPEEKDGISNKNTLLKIQYAEYLILIAKYDDAIIFFDKIYKETDNDYVKAVCLIGKSTAMTSHSGGFNRKQIAKYYSWILENKKLKKKAIYGKALMESGYLKSSSNGFEKEALPFFIQYCELFPSGKYYRASKFMQGDCYLALKQLHKAEEIYQILKSEDDLYSKILFLAIKRAKTRKESTK